jgi:uncharacterized membrane protein YdcZ (DUF606 family)
LPCSSSAISPALSATVSALTLIAAAFVVYRLPFPKADLFEAQALKVVAGGMMGACILAGLTSVAPRLGPTQTFILYFFVITATSVLIRANQRWRWDDRKRFRTT